MHSDALAIWASAWQNLQNLPSLIRVRCPHEESLGAELPTERTAKTLIRLGGCLGWSESSLGAHAIFLRFVMRWLIWAKSKWRGHLYTLDTRLISKWNIIHFAIELHRKRFIFKKKKLFRHPNPFPASPPPPPARIPPPPPPLLSHPVSVKSLCRHLDMHISHIICRCLPETRGSGVWHPWIFFFFFFFFSFFALSM